LGSWLGWQYPDLHGAVNDINLIAGILASPQLGYRDIVVLRNEQATADAILSALQHALIDSSSSGDLRFVYYSGHGGTVRNLASKERYQLDQTIVPYDHYKGDVPDIRDKELSRILWKAGKKGVKVIFIADSCHSGGLSRGRWNERGVTRTARDAPPWDANPYPVQITDPADIDPATGKEINPIDAGVVVVAAAQEDESAQEEPYTPDGTHGAFTWALKRSLEQGLDQPLDVVVRRASSLLKAGTFAQTPELRGKDTHAVSLFGLKAASVASTTAVVERVAGRTIILRGGKALGIYEGTEMRRILSSGEPVAIQVTRSLDLVRSEAERIDSNAPIHANDVFEVSKWAVPEEPALKLYMPPSAPDRMIAEAAAETGKLRSDKTIQWVDDLTQAGVSRVMHWDGARWILESNPAAGKPVDLGLHPAAGDVRKLLDPGARFFLLLPPAASLVEALKVQPSIAILRQPGGDHYRLAGRASGSGIEYAWVQPDATEESFRNMAGGKNTVERLPLPLRTDWVALEQGAAEDLADKATRLGRLRSWLTLLSPPPGRDSKAAFPYHLAFKDLAQPGFLATNQMTGGHRYKVYLRAAEADLANGVADRMVYLFSVDHYGKGTLLFPAPGEGNAGNRFPKRNNGEIDLRPDIPLSEAEYDFDTTEPYGVDTFILLATKEPIEDTQIFEFDGVRSRGTGHGEYKDRLTELLSGIGGSRAAQRNPTVPTTWSVEQVPVLSSK
jgi:hypothetical protein